MYIGSWHKNTKNTLLITSHNNKFSVFRAWRHIIIVKDISKEVVTFSIQSLTRWKQVLSIMSQCLYCCLNYAACNSHVFCLFVACYVVSSVACLAVLYFFKLPRKIVSDIKCGLVFCIQTIIRNLHHSKKNLLRCRKLMYVSSEVPTIFFVPILTEFEIFSTYLNKSAQF